MLHSNNKGFTVICLLEIQVKSGTNFVNHEFVFQIKSKLISWYTQSIGIYFLLVLIPKNYGVLTLIKRRRRS